MGATQLAADDTLAAALDWACSQPGWWHDSGNLNPAVLRAIANHAARIGARDTAESGCGLSTVLLSTVAERHTCFTIAAGNSLERVQNVPHLRQDRVNFVVGPSQVTIPRHSFSRPLDLVLIDGPHGFPFAHVEYYFFYQRIRKGGIFSSWTTFIFRQSGSCTTFCATRRCGFMSMKVLTTAFFQRSDAPLFDPYGDGWERQQFNQRHFEDSASMDLYCPGWRDAMPPPPGPLLGSAFPVAAGLTVAGSPSVAGSSCDHEETERLRAENAAFRASTSWRITAPLRAVVSSLRGR